MEMENNSELIADISGDQINNASSDSDVEDPFKKLIKLITSFYLNSLETIFGQKVKHKPATGSASEHKERGLSKSEFVDAINDVFGEENYASEAIDLFNEIDKQEDREVTWMQFLDYLTNISKIKPYPKLELGNHKITAIPHVMRDTIVKIVLIESDKYFCYAIISKYGRVGLYDGNMNFLISYHVIMTKDDEARNDEQRRRRNRWITDAIYLPDIYMMFIANSTRSITVYDASGLRHVPIWLIVGYPNMICTMCYYCEEATNTSVIYVGDETGLVTSLTFLQSKTGLLRRKHNDKLSTFYWNEISNESAFVVVKDLYKCHNEMVKKLKYFPSKKVLVTCSRDAKNSVVIKNLTQKRKPYIFKMRRGSNCFALSKSTLITGSDDGTIRIWNSVITNKPLAILNQHKTGIVDLVHVEFLPFFISCSRDGVLKLWDTKSESCIQTEIFKFPPFKVHGKSIDWGVNSIYPGPKRRTNLDFDESQTSNSFNNESNHLWQRTHVIITCCNYIATVNMNFLDEEFRSNFDQPVLIPPPLQNSVLIPNTWDVNEDHPPIEDVDDDFDVSDEVIQSRLDSLKFVLEKDLLEELGLKHNINQKIAQLEAKKAEMQLSVERCAPFLALDLHDFQEVSLDETLPVPNRRKIRALVDCTHQMLVDASARNQIFSEPTSSSRLSSRSSIMDFD